MLKVKAYAVPNGRAELVERNELPAPQWHSGRRDGPWQDHPGYRLPGSPQGDWPDHSQQSPSHRSPCVHSR